MINVFSSIRSLIKLDAVRIDNMCFRLHYKLTTILLVAFSMLVTSRQFAGNAIRCLANGVPSEMMESYCWVYSTFTVKNLRHSPHALRPGVGGAPTGELQYHTYYQWVCFVLFVQAALFYVPRYVWKAWEGDRMRTLCTDLMEIGREQEPAVARKKEAVVNYFLMENRRADNGYVYKLFACELLNAFNVCAQIWFIDRFLDGQFRLYGPRAVNGGAADTVFPKMTKCTFYKYGSSGTLQHFDGLCVLPLNIVNEKIYAFLWFWFTALAVVTAGAILYRIATFASAPMRQRLLCGGGNFFAPTNSQNGVRAIADAFNLSNWFMLHQLGKNVNPLLFTDIILELSQKLRTGAPV